MVADKAKTEPAELLINELPISLYDNDLHLKISSIGLGIIDAVITKYDHTLIQKNIGSLNDWLGNDFIENDITNGKSIIYVDSENNLTIKQSFSFLSEPNSVELEINFVSNSDKTSYINYGLNVATIDESKIQKSSLDYRYLEFSLAFPTHTARKQFFAFHELALLDQPKWIGVRDKYFCSVIVPMQAIERIEKAKDLGKTSYIAYSKVELKPGVPVSHKFKIYLGPQNPTLISEFNPGCESIVNYGFFDVLSQMLLGTLKFINRFCNNWGLTIIVFSFIVFAVMSPLSIKSFSSMKAMQQLQPEVELIKNKFKNDPQKTQREIMNLYKEKKINPMGGCLPLVLQMPIFVSLFNLLSRFVDLKGAGFLWINDLSAPDRLVTLPNKLPIIGNELNLLPILMIITSLIQQRFTSSSQMGSGTSANQQKMMSIFMAVFFGIIFYSMPSGLVLYWFVNSLLMVCFQARLFMVPKKA